MGANFIIPGLYEHHQLNFALLTLLKIHPEYFYDDVKITAIYGSFQFSIFDGGRIFNSYKHTNKEEIEHIVHTYNEVYNVPIRLVCTNCELKPEDYKNRFGNVVLSLCENDMNEIVVNHSGFEQYVRETYPQYSFISSTTKCLNTPKEFLQELNTNKYKMICLDYNLNKNMSLLEKISEERRKECEFLVNAICPPGCPNRKKHYSLNSLFSLSYGKPYTIENCPIEYSTVHPACFSYKNNLSPEDIYNTYVPMGYNLFKLEGRTLSEIENACNYVRYMVKPEYHFQALTLLLKSVYE